MITVNGVGVSDRIAAVRELLRQRAATLGLIAADGGTLRDDDAIERLLECEVRVPEPTDAECRRYYDTHPADFMAGELVFARHILFGVVAGVPIDPLRRKAEESLVAVSAHPERFADLAAQLSNCPSGQHGGNLGQLGRGDSVPEFERALFDTTATGVLPRLVNTRYGFHVVAIEGRVPGRRVPFEAVCAQIAARLTGRVRAKALLQYVAVLAGKADVRGTDLRAAASPLVQ